jgi:NAD(P)-dependent dehydrogenase (short-subunit alcohol dehydrogenase family)
VRALFHVFQQSAARMADNGRLIHIGTSLTAGSAPGYALYSGTKAPAEEFCRMVAKEEDIVPLVSFLASPQSQWVNGQTHGINGSYITR